MLLTKVSLFLCVTYKKVMITENKFDLELLDRATGCHAALRGFREDRERCKRFTYGDQWGDYMEDRGARMRESEYLASQGNMPLKNNLIRRLVRNVLGVYRNRWVRPGCRCADTESTRSLNRMLDSYMRRNRLEELYARTMEEFLISGLAVHKKWFGRIGNRPGCRTDMVSADDFFFDPSARDFRGFDMNIIGEVHEVTFDDVLAEFASDDSDEDALRRLYGVRPGCDDGQHCRIFEVWHKVRRTSVYVHDADKGEVGESGLPAAGRARVNAMRMEASMSPLRCVHRSGEEWRYSFLAPDGRVLAEGASPYSHGGHPYVVKAYPFIDAEIHSFVGDIIDQQKLTNRLITMYDWILRASAKGVLLFPEGSFPEGVDINDIAEEWSRFNGVIVYKPRPGVPLPQQVSSRSADIGITELLEIQMKMMEDISGVNGALQGKLESNSMSGTLYDQQTRNSLTALADILKCFDDFIVEGTRMDVSNLLQYGEGDDGGIVVTIRLTDNPAS